MRPVVTSVLKNGFYIYSQYDPTNSTNLCGIIVRVGASSDPPQFHGLAHLLEHVIFRKTETRSLEDVLIAAHRLGGVDSFEIFTGQLNTFYGTPNMRYRHYVREYFALMADLIRNFKVDLMGLKTEKAAINQEIFLMGRDNLPDEIINFLYENVYTKNPIRNRIDGNPETIKAIPPSRIKNFYNKYYIASNMAAVILGPKHKDAVRMVKEFFGDMPQCGIPERFRDYEPFDEELPIFSTIKTVVQERPGIHLAHLAIGFPLKVESKDAPAFELIAKILRFRLWMRLREENQDFDRGTYCNSAWFETSELHSMLVVRTATNAKHLDRAAEIITDEFKRLKDECVSEQLLKTSAQALVSDWHNSFDQSSEALCDLLIDAFVSNDNELRALYRYPKILRRLTPKKLMTLANQYINPQCSVRAIIKPA